MVENSEVVLTIGAVAHQLGVAVPTLRSWAHRYGLGPSEHVPGRHRRYSAEDLERLRHMVLLTGEGIPPASAARHVLTQTPEHDLPRDGGGTGSLAVGRAAREVRGLARAATRLDVQGVRRLVERHVDQRGALRAWQEILAPVLRSIGESYEQGSDGIVAVEHTATAGFLAALHGLRPLPEGGRLPALLACAPEEQHALPLEALHAALAQHECPSRFLGPRVPSDVVVRAARKVRPRSIVIWAHSARLARKTAVAEIAEHCPRLLLCGPGWEGVRVARDHVQVDSLEEAVRVVVEQRPLLRASALSRRQVEGP